jgi:lipopolysaccharide/colanic/teichoic acid biosynthesis glycosyltransferase
MYKFFIKRLIDVLASLGVIIILFPFFILVYILVKLDSKGPFFFFQERLGYQAKIFKVYKIRTMYDKPRVANREILRGDSEVTKIGAILRRFKIDELPQIINVFVGDMSLVGPRPCLPQQQADFDNHAKQRIKVRPGLTGLAQVNGNIYLTWPERWVYDSRYVSQCSFLLDVKIVLKTLLILFRGEDKFIKKPNV